jgi:hypothetical protein
VNQKLGNTLYKLHKSILQRRLELFEGMFDIPAGTSDLEGSDTNPIRIPSEVTQYEWESLLEFIYDRQVKYCVRVPVHYIGH